jgi:hypothetical protein
MQIVYGNFALPAGGVSVAESGVTERNAGGQPLNFKQSWTLTGRLDGLPNQDAVAAAMAAMQVAFLTPYQDLVLKTDGGNVARALLNAGSITGVVCDGINWVDGKGAEGGTYRSFSATFSATYPLSAATEFLLEFTETLSFRGGGPVFGHIETRQGLPQKQLVRQNSLYRCTQQGAAIGRNGYPPIPQPIFPGALVQNPDTSSTSPKRKGFGLEGFQVSWAYQFESATPLGGFPNVWTF